jgi:hypothetical protein
MLKRFTNWTYSLGDSLNPLIVREIRRELRIGSYFIVIGLYLFFFTILLCLRFVGVINNEELLSIFSMLCFMIWLGGFFLGHLVIRDMNECTNRDETFFLIPLSPRQYFYAYWGLSTFCSLFIISLSLPLLFVMIIIGRSCSLLAIPITVFLVSQAFILITLSFMSQSTSAGIKYTLTVYDHLRMSLLIIFNTFSFSLWLIILVARIDYWSFQDWQMWEKVNLIHFFILMIIFLIICRVAYKLNLRGFNKNRNPKFGKLFQNTLVYFLINIILATIYYTITSAFF